LQQILVYRELGFPREEIAAILDDPAADALSPLRRPPELLTREAGRRRGVIAAVARAIEARTRGIALSPAARLQVFGSCTPAAHEAEVERRWGGGDAYEQSRRRVAALTKADWLELKAEGEAIRRDLAAACEAGLPADGEAAMDLAERHRGHISRWF